MRRFITILALLLAAASITSTASAQAISAVRPYAVAATLSATGANTCGTGVPATTGCVGIKLGGYAGLSVQLSGTWTGTVTFEVSNRCSTVGGEWLSVMLVKTDDNTLAPVATSTGNGIWAGATQAACFRVRFTRSSGSVVVTAQASLNVAKLGGTTTPSVTGAPAGATYVVQTSNGSLTSAQDLASLGTGLVTSTTATGVVSTLAPTDDRVVVGNGTAWQLKALADCAGAGKAVTYDASTNTFGCNTIVSGNPFDQDLNTTDSPTFAGLAVPTFTNGTDPATISVRPITEDVFDDEASLWIGDLDGSMHEGPEASIIFGGFFNSRTDWGGGMLWASHNGTYGSVHLKTIAANGSKLGDITVDVQHAAFGVSELVLNQATASMTAGSQGFQMQQATNDLTYSISGQPIVLFNAAGVVTVPVAVGDLPTCNGGLEGAHSAVTNSNAASFTAGIGAIVAAGGSTHVPVYCDGTNWRIG